MRVFLSAFCFALLLTILSACSDDSAGKPDGDAVDGDLTNGDADAADADGDATDGDGDNSDSAACQGACDPTRDKTVCTDNGNLCSCESRNWMFFSCADFCKNDGGKIARGCDYDTVMQTDWCLCAAPEDGDASDGDDDGVDPDCHGPCGLESDPPECVRHMELCTCDPETNTKVALDCNDICREGNYCGADSCDYSIHAGNDVCYCNNCTCECQSDDECKDWGEGDYCVSMGQSTECVWRCDLAVTPDNKGCIDLGIGDDCGVAIDFGDDRLCETLGESCGEGKVCHDICGLYDKICSPICEAIPNSCEGAGELCWPLKDSIGPIDGICVNYGADCPDCEPQPIDGDSEQEIDGDSDTATDGDTDLETSPDGDSDAELETEPAARPHAIPASLPRPARHPLHHLSVDPARHRP